MRSVRNEKWWLKSAVVMLTLATFLPLPSAIAQTQGPPATPAAAQAAPAKAPPPVAAPAPVKTVPAAPAKAMPVVPPAAGKAAAVLPDAAKAEAAPFTLLQATQGLPGNGPLRATIDVEQGGKPLGTLRCELFSDKTPLTVANFVGLARGTRPHRDPRSEKSIKTPLYDGNQFHRLIPELLIQGGDPNCADANCLGQHGIGDPGYKIPDEIRDELRFDRGGRLGMALRGEPGTGGSQFFITAREMPWLNGNHTVFGQCEPLDTIRAISNLETGALDVPKVPVRIKRVVISRGAIQTAAAPTPKRP